MKVLWICDDYVCVSFCLSVCVSSARMSQIPHFHISRNFLYMLPVALAWSSSDNSAIHYVTSGFVPTGWLVTPCSSKCTHLPWCCGGIMHCWHPQQSQMSAFTTVRGAGSKVAITRCLVVFNEQFHTKHMPLVLRAGKVEVDLISHDFLPCSWWCWYVTWFRHQLISVARVSHFRVLRPIALLWWYCMYRWKFC